jgi:LPXTG-motif cell wall-anchored protein
VEQPAPPDVAGVEAPRAPAFVPGPSQAPAQGFLPVTGMGELERTLGLVGAGMLLSGMVLLLRRRTT